MKPTRDDIVESAVQAFAAYRGLGKEIVDEMIAEIRRLRAMHTELYAELTDLVMRLDRARRHAGSDEEFVGIATSKAHAALAKARNGAARRDTPPPEAATTATKCPSCHREFKNGDTCRMGGCPMGGDI